MKWLLPLFSLLMVLLMAADSNAQTPDPAAANNADNEDRTILMRNEVTGGLLLHSSGWGISLRRAKQKTVKQKRYLEVDIVSMKDPKEVRSLNTNYESSTSFIFGKKNSFIVPRIGIGRQHVIFAKAHTTGVEVRCHYGLGAALGLTKPVYLNVIEGTSEQYYVVKKYDDIKTNYPFIGDTLYPDAIFGDASFTYGFGEMKLHPGGYIKSGVSFEYAKFQDQIWSVETGVVVDFYPEEIPIMAFIENKKIFINFYVSLSYGKKW